MVNLKKLRKHKGVSQEKLCDELKISIHTYRPWEQKRTNPEIPNLLDLADYLGCSLDELFGRDPKYYSSGDRRQELDNNESTLVNFWRVIDDQGRVTLMDVASSLSTSNRKDTEDEADRRQAVA
jgi:transcriptional regulator with XRE-family HTH domain